MVRSWRPLASALGIAAVLLGGAKACSQRGARPKLPAAGVAPGTGARPVEILDEGVDYRIVRHAAGTTRVPARPQRICALSSADELLAVGVMPVAHSIIDGNFPDYLARPLAQVPWIPNVYGAHMPDMEAVIAARPDLIVTRTTSRQIYEQLSRIAPVVVVLDHLDHYRQRVLDIGSIVGRRRQAEARVAWYDAKVAAAREVLARSLNGGSMALIRVRPKMYRLYGGEHHVDPVLYDDLGVRRPWLVEHRAWSVTTSPEALLRLDADWIIIAVDAAVGSQRTLTDLLGHPVWQRIPAVRQGHVLLIDEYRHWADAGILGRARAIDDVVRAVAPAELEAVNAQAELALRRGGR